MAIENLDKLISKLEKLDDVNQAMEQACILVENEAKIKCPVDNGLLRNSITHYIEDNPNELVGVVGTNVEYAPYVEFGTGIYSSLGNGRQDRWKYKDAKGEWHSTIGQHPQPYLQPALEENRRKIEKMFKEQVKKGVEPLTNNS